MNFFVVYFFSCLMVSCDGWVEQKGDFANNSKSHCEN